jgi:D-threo-aldose 1-dehydrogenase
MAIETRRIGTTDIEVTKIGLGGAFLGRASEAEATPVVDAAWDGGVRYFDTAPLYGMGSSERRDGAALSPRPRDEFVLSTKIGRLLVPGDGDSDSNALKVQYDYSAEGVRTSFEASLERLGLDRIDILLCHDIDTWTHHEGQPAIYEAARSGALRALAELREQGVIGAWGLGVNEWQVCDRVLDEFEPDCFLLAGRFTLLEQEPLEALLPRCVEREVSVIIGGPYNSGLLANADRAEATYDYKPVEDERWERAQRIRAVCDAHGVDIRAAALQYPLRHASVAAVIPGARSVAEVTANLELVEAPIPDALWDDLASEGLAPRI